MSKYDEIADKYLDIKIRGTSEIMAACPFCDGSSSFQFNLDRGLWICFRCDAKGNAKQFVNAMGDIYTNPTVSVDFLNKMFERIAHPRQDTGEKILDEDYLLRFQGYDHNYWLRRGFSRTTIEKWNLGYDPIKDRATIPYRNLQGNLLGVIQRRLGDIEGPRYIYPKHFDRKSMLFGSWAIGRHKRVALVEGSTDVISLDEEMIPALGQYGSHITSQQIRLLHRLGIREVVLFYDYDEAGFKATFQAMEEISGILVSRVVYDADRFCWTKKLCGCGEHDWKTIGQCNYRRVCKCGRQHEMDPGKLDYHDIRMMWRNRVMMGDLNAGNLPGQEMPQKIYGKTRRKT